jgi:hypothetical protein
MKYPINNLKKVLFNSIVLFNNILKLNFISPLSRKHIAVKTSPEFMKNMIITKYTLEFQKISAKFLKIFSVDGKVGCSNIGRKKSSIKSDISLRWRLCLIFF